MDGDINKKVKTTLVFVCVTTVLKDWAEKGDGCMSPHLCQIEVTNSYSTNKTVIV